MLWWQGTGSQTGCLAYPFSVDGMIVAASTTLLADSRTGWRSGVLPRALLVAGSVASLAANVAVAEPTLIGRVIEQVTFIGYPKGLYDTVNMLPVARQGWTATPISIDYEGQPKFLVDASVFGGSSGSPVLALNSGAYQERAGAAHYGSPYAVLLGIIAESWSFPATGTVQIGGAPSDFDVSQALNFGTVYKASAIIEAIDHFLSAQGSCGNPPTLPHRRPPYGLWTRLDQVHGLAT
jgi:hypothetical protein